MCADNVIRAFSEAHASQLTGLTIGQLRAWDKRGFFSPHYAYENRHSPYSRVYSFKDIVGLRTIALLMKEYRVSLPKLSDAAERLVRRGYEHWADLILYVVNREVHFREPGSTEVEGVVDGQLAMLPVIDVINDVESRIEELQKRPEHTHGQIRKQRHVVRNSPVVAGTRIPTATIRRFSEAGYSVEQILQEYPTLTAKDVRAALAYEERLAKSA